MSSSLLLAKRRLALLCTASRRVDPWCWHTVAGAMDCYEALNEQQVDLAQQLKALVAPLVQVGGRTWLILPPNVIPSSSAGGKRINHYMCRVRITRAGLKSGCSKQRIWNG